METLRQLLDRLSVKKDDKQEISIEYAEPVKNDLKSIFDTTVKFRYGGSLIKGTANIDSCDIDLLCYLKSDSNLSLKIIFDNAVKTLKEKKYNFEVKNSAICVKGKANEDAWDYSIDVVPGKYVSEEEHADVYLYCKKTDSRLKTNPYIQITKVQESKCHDLIRLIKRFRTQHSFYFKSFYLELFIIDIVEPEIKDDDSLIEQLHKFCLHVDDIGVKRVYDPANKDNDIMVIHSEQEYQTIRNHINKLKEIVLTNSEEDIVNYINGISCNIDDAYIRYAKTNEKNNIKYLSSPKINVVRIEAYCNGQSFNTCQNIKKDKHLVFDINTQIINQAQLNIRNVQWTICNSGLEAAEDECLRGQNEKTDFDQGRKVNSSYSKYSRSEDTLYYGNHYVQAVVNTDKGTYYSQIFTVRIR
ncbi:MAG: hypothetical protein WC123_05830 [Bacilli bacterium]|jgi:ribosomal protein S13